jgi:hypothetical protein
LTRSPELCWLPECTSMRTRPGWIEAEVYFSIIHLAQVGHPGVTLPPHCEQAVEITLGPKGAFENGNIGVLTRRVPSDSVISGMPPRQGKPKPPREPGRLGWSSY